MQKKGEPWVLKRRPHQGELPIPYAQYVDNKGVPDFRTLDTVKILDCIQKRLCGLCGEELSRTVVFIGGSRSGEGHMFVDPPMHPRCAHFAGKVCPHLNGQKRLYRPITEKAQGRAQDAGIVLVENQDVSDAPVERIYFYTTREYRAVRTPGGGIGFSVSAYDSVEEISTQGEGP